MGMENMRLVSVILLFAATVVVVATLGLLAFGGPKAESNLVKKKQLQAVFLAGGQVYFGNIGNLNDKYMSMSNIYYLRVNQTVQPKQQTSNNQQQATSNDISLVKLGCELHGPTDEMVINREQVIFWENLKSDGQVAKAVAEYVKQNPNGQNCTTTNSNTNSSTNKSSTSGSSSTTNSATTNGATGTTQTQTQNSTSTGTGTGSTTGTGANQ
jgi:hypothetical protein